MLTAFRSPLYDSPATTGFVDRSTGVMFTSDCFGAPVTTPELVAAADVAAIPDAVHDSAQRLRTTVDSPWVHGDDRQLFHARWSPSANSTRPWCGVPTCRRRRRRIDEFLDRLQTAPDDVSYAGPDQARA